MLAIVRDNLRIHATEFVNISLVNLVIRSSCRGSNDTTEFNKTINLNVSRSHMHGKLTAQSLILKYYFISEAY